MDVIEMLDLLPQDEVFQQRGAAQASLSEFWLSLSGVPSLVVSRASGAVSV